jgi:type II secretion system protein D
VLVFRLTLLLALLAVGFGAFAQNPAPPVAPPLPGTPAAETVDLKFPNADIKEVLDYYERLTGKRLVRDNQVIGQVNIVINQPLPKEDVIRIIEISLLMNGFSLVPADEKKNIWKVIGTGKNPRNFGIPILSDANQLPDTEQVVTFLAKLEYADPTEIATVLGQAIPPSPNLGQTITPLPKAGALLITENTVIIKGILRILREIDLPPATVVSEFFELKRADAKDVLEKLQDIIAPKGQTGTPIATPAVPRPNLARQQPATTPDGLPAPQLPATVDVTGPNTIEVNAGRVLSEDAVVVGKTIIQADQRTNRIHIVTRPINVKFFAKLIDQLDADTVFGEPVTFPLKFVSAGDIIDAMKKAISDPGAKEEAGGGTGTRPGQTNRGSTGSTQNLNDNNRFGNNNTGGFGGGGGGTGGFSESLNTEERDIIPEAFTVGNTRIIADKRANAIIVIGNEDVQQKVAAFLKRIDVRAPQVMIRTVIGTLSLTNDEQFGVDYILRKGSNLGSVTTGTDGTTTTSNLVVNPAALTNPVGLNLTNLLTQSAVTQIATGGASGLSGFFTAGNALDVIVRALQSTTRFKVNATPSIFTSNNKKAVISAGSEIAVPTSTISSGVNANNGLSQNTNIQFKTIALQLEVLPLINADGEVSLEIVQKIDEQDGSTRIDNNDIPKIATRSLKTNIIVPSGATIVLGGLRRERDNVTKSGIPYLSKIPGIGALFRSTVANKTREELVILMRPVVTFTPRGAVEERERELDGFVLEPDLEAAITPRGVRKNVPASEAFRSDTLKLRESTPVPIRKLSRPSGK